MWETPAVHFFVGLILAGSEANSSGPIQKGHEGRVRAYCQTGRVVFETVGCPAQSGPHRFSQSLPGDSLEGQIVFWNIVGSLSA